MLNTQTDSADRLRALIEISKHLPGKHDQADHAGDRTRYKEITLDDANKKGWFLESWQEKWLREGDVKIYEVPVADSKYRLQANAEPPISSNDPKVIDMLKTWKEGKYKTPLIQGFELEDGGYSYNDGQHRFTAWSLLHDTIPMLMAPRQVKKHLPGEHNQADYAGNRGGRGGGDSVTSKAVQNLIDVRNEIRQLRKSGVSLTAVMVSLSQQLDWAGDHASSFTEVLMQRKFKNPSNYSTRINTFLVKNKKQITISPLLKQFLIRVEQGHWKKYEAFINEDESSIGKHLPGKHNQKMHGRMGTAKGYVKAEGSIIDNGDGTGRLVIALRGLGVSAENREYIISGGVYKTSELTGNEPIIRSSDSLLDLRELLSDYETHLGEHAGGSNKEYIKIVDETDASIEMIRDMEKQLLGKDSETPQELADSVALFIEELINQNTILQSTLSNAIGYANSMHVSQYVAEGIQVYDQDKELVDEINNVGYDSGTKLYDLDDLDARFGEFNDDSLSTARSAVWARLGPIRTGLIEYVSPMIKREGVRATLEKVLDDETDAFDHAYKDYQQLVQWAFRHKYGDSVKAFRGLQSRSSIDSASNASAAALKSGLKELTSVSTSQRVAEGFTDEDFVLSVNVHVSQVMSFWLTDEKMFRTGEEEILTSSRISASQVSDAYGH